MLTNFIVAHRNEIIARCREKVLKRTGAPTMVAEVDHGVPMFLDELTAELQRGLSPNPDIATTAAKHGHDLMRQGLTPSEVVHSYGDVCQAVTEMAVEKDAPITSNDFRMLNRCLDEAIAAAITRYGEDYATLAKDAALRDTNNICVLGDALRAALASAKESLGAIKAGTVGLVGSTGQLLERSIAGAQELNERLQEQIGIFAAQEEPESRRQRNQAEAAVRKGRDRAQRYLDTADVIVLALDLDARITLINRKGCDVVGWTEGELLGRDWVETCLPARIRQTLEAKRHNIICGDCSIVENPILVKTGEERLIEWHNAVMRDDDGHVIGTFSSGTDVTNRH
jgi:PAS domain S-box-containing protein